MATITANRRADRVALAGPDGLERVLGWAALAMLAVILTALARGHADWGKVPGVVWLHLATMGLALALTPAILWRPRGSLRHRQLGYAWVGALAVTALDSLLIRRNGQFSLIHVLSVWTFIQLPLIVWSARTGNHRRHRRAVRAMVIGALLIAGFFTFPFGRMLGTWLLGA